MQEISSFTSVGVTELKANDRYAQGTSSLNSLDFDLNKITSCGTKTYCCEIEYEVILLS